VYGPYEEQIPLWEDLLDHNFLKAKKAIMGGDLNLTIKSI